MSVSKKIFSNSPECCTLELFLERKFSSKPVRHKRAETFTKLQLELDQTPRQEESIIDSYQSSNNQPHLCDLIERNSL